MDTYTNTGFFIGFPLLSFASLLLELLPVVAAIFIAVKFYKLQKEKNMILKAIENKLDILKK